MTKTEYEIVSEFGRSEFVKEMNEMIEAGWRPVGGISESEAHFSQAVIRHTDREEQT